MDPQRLRLMVITDSRLAGDRGVVRQVERALGAGAPAVQLREKEMGAGAALELGRRLRTLTREHGALFLVNDRLDLALATEADGVHLGPADLPVAEVRRHAPPDFLIGYSTDDPETAGQAQADGADYLGCGTVWPTSSKEDPGAVIGPEGLAQVAAAVSIPVVAIGGITPARARELAGCGAVGIAVIGAIMAAPQPAGTVRDLLAAAQSF